MSTSSTPRRRLIRPHQPPTNDRADQERIQKLRSRLEAERTTLVRWMVRLKRAFHAVEKIQRRMNRIERQLARSEK